jgi:hypothetical protein
MRKLCLLLLLCNNVAIAFSQDSAVVAKKINELEQLSIKSLLAGDTAMLKKLWAPGFMVNTPRNNVAPDRNAVLEIQRNGLINYSSFTRVVEKMQMQKDVVITMGYETYVPKENLPMAGQTVKRRFTNVWLNQDGQWVHIARHASIICAGE